MSHMGLAVTSVLSAPRMGKVLGRVKRPGATGAQEPRGPQVFLYLSVHLVTYGCGYGLYSSLLPQITER